MDKLPYVPMKEGEDRKTYLARVMVAYLRQCYAVDDGVLVFDNAECDGACLADDIEAEWGFDHEPHEILPSQVQEL